MTAWSDDLFEIMPYHIDDNSSDNSWETGDGDEPIDKFIVGVGLDNNQDFTHGECNQRDYSSTYDWCQDDGLG
jgi:hypothetical protein